MHRAELMRVRASNPYNRMRGSCGASTQKKFMTTNHSRKVASDAGRKVCRVGKMGGSVCRHPSDCRHKTCRYPKHMPWIKNQHKARCGFAKNQVIYIIVIMFRLRV